jgi:uncharacterized protein YbjT (DUF2867 family)
MQESRVLVTSAAGHIGREVVLALSAGAASSARLVVRAGDRSTAAVEAMHGPRVEVACLDYERPETFAGAVAGCRALFLTRPPSVARVESTLLPFLDVALAEGVEHVVFLSVAGAATHALVPHHAVERYLAARAPSFTLLRPGFFSQNLGLAYREDIVEGRLVLAAGRERVAFVDVRDVAELAAAILAAPSRHRGSAYTCTGKEALSFEEAALLLSEVLERPVRFEAASIAGYVRHLHLRGMALPQIAVQTLLHVGLRLGGEAAIDPTLERLLGRPPRGLASYIRESASLWSQLPTGPEPSTARLAAPPLPAGRSPTLLFA